MKMEKRLISKVCEHEFLYAIDSAHYRDRNMRAKAWTEIGKDLGLPAAQCKDMWRKLRNCYLNAIARRQTKYIPKWKHEDEMSFLLPFIDIKSNSEPDLDIHGLAVTSYSDGNEDTFSEREDASEVYHPESSIVPKAEPEDQETDSKDLLRHAFSHARRRPLPPALDETTMFFTSVCETVKRLKPVHQARIKMQLSKLVYEAEIQQLESEEPQ